ASELVLRSLPAPKPRKRVTPASAAGPLHVRCPDTIPPPRSPGAGNRRRIGQQQPTMSVQPHVAAVERRFEWWPAPAAPATPARYNRVGVRRFRLVGASAPAAVLILSAGFMGGINLLDYLANEVTAACGGRIEVWTTERRNNR